MKHISRFLRYDDQLLDNKIPDEIKLLPDPGYDYPVFIRGNAIPRQLCDEIVADVTSNVYCERATVGGAGSARSAIADSRVSESIRKTDYLIMSPQHQDIYNNALTMVQPEIERFFGMPLIETGEKSVLGYGPGDHYILHADNATPKYDETGDWEGWEITNHYRVISTILFFTDSVMELSGANECVGGNISFNLLLHENNAPFLVEPEKGLLLAFPSNPYFSHRVNEVYDGYRVSVVSWYDKRNP